MSWLTIAIAILAAILVINVVIYFIRHWKVRDQIKPKSKGGRKRITGTGIILYTFLIAALLAREVVPLIVPNTVFASWVHTDYSLITYLVLCIIVLVFLEVILTLCGLPAWKEENKKSDRS